MAWNVIHALLWTAGLSVFGIVLGLFFSGDELHIVDDQYINIAVLVGVALLFEANTFEVIFVKCFDGRVEHARGRLTTENLIANGLHEVGFTESGAAVKVKRVVLCAGVSGDSLAGSVGEIIARADDEIVEGVARVEVARIEFFTRLDE